MAAQIVETSDPAQTESFGAQVAAHLRGGDVVLVRGELGSGKTTFVRGAARALGVQGPITSPTFSIGHLYRGAGVTVAHLDLYRVAALAEEDPGLLADHLGDDRIAFVEWPEDGATPLAQARLRVTLEHRGEDRRHIVLEELAARPEREA